MISIVILTKNEENFIVDCIESAQKLASEIIVIDSNSKDNTRELAEKHKAKVYLENSQDFAAKRNLGLSKAKGDWVFYIDADERVTKELAESIVHALENPQYAAYKVKRKNFYFGNHEWPHQDILERLFRKDALSKWYGVLHESPKVEGPIGTLSGCLHHYSHRDLTSMLEKTIEWSKIEAELRFKAHHPKMTWWRFPRVMVTAFYSSYIHQGGWKAGTVGVVESIYQSFSMFITYARLWELQNK